MLKWCLCLNGKVCSTEGKRCSVSLGFLLILSMINYVHLLETKFRILVGS